MKKLLLYLGIPVASLLAYAAISYAATPVLNIYQGGTSASSTAGYLGAQDRLGITGDVVLHRVSNNSDLVINASSTIGSDTGRGLALVYAVTMGSNGDFIYLASSTYDVQGVKLDPGSKNISIIGAGKYSTIIKGSNTTIIAVDGTSGLTLRDFSVYGTLGGGSIQFPIAGQTSANINNLVIDSIYTNNPSDGLYFSMVNSYATTTIKNVTCDSKWDCMYWLAKGGEGRIYDSVFTAAADASINSAGNAHAVIVGPNNKANLYIYNSKAYASGATETAGIRNDSAASGGKIYSFNTDATAFASSSSGVGRAIYGNNGAQIYVDGGYLQSSGRSNSFDLSGGILNSIHVTSHTIYTAASSSLTTIDYIDWPMLDLAHAYNSYFRVGSTAARGIFDLNKIPTVTGSAIAATGGSGNFDGTNARTVSFDVYGYYTKNGTTYYTAAQNVAYAESGAPGAYYLTVTWNPVFLATGYKIVTNPASGYAIIDGKATTTTARSVTPGDGSETSWTTNLTVTPKATDPKIVADAWTGYFGIASSSPSVALSVNGSEQLDGNLTIGNAVPVQPNGFGTGNYQFLISSSSNDIVGGNIWNTNAGAQSGTGLFFANNLTPINVVGLAATYYGGMVFSGSNWNGPALGLGALPPNSLGVYATDGSLILGAATSTGNIDFYTGAGSFAGGVPDARLTNTGRFGIATSSPYAALSVVGSTGVVAGKYTATSTMAASTFPYASTTVVSSDTICLTADLPCRTTWPTGSSGGTNGMLTSWTGATTLTATSGPTAAYYTATSSLATSTFQGGITAAIGGGTGVVIGTSTSIFPATTTPFSKLSVYNGAMFSSMTNSTGLKVDGTITDGTNLATAWAVFYSNNLLYALSSGSNFTILDAASSTGLRVISSITDATKLLSPTSQFLSGHNDIIVGNNILTIVDVSNPGAPVITGSVTDTKLASTQRVFVVGRYAFTAGQGTTQFSVVDIGDQTAPKLVSSISSNTFLGGANTLHCQGDYCYVADFGSGINRITAINKANPYAPFIAGSLQDATYINRPQGLFVQGNYAYLANNAGKSLTVVDISNPTAMTIAGTTTVTDNRLTGAVDIFVYGDYAYVASQTYQPSGGVQGQVTIWNVHDVTNITFVGNLPAGTIRSLEVAGRHIYTANQNSNSISADQFPGLDAPGADIGSLLVGNMKVKTSVDVGQNFVTHGGLSVGQGILADGFSRFGVTATTSLLLSPTLDVLIGDSNATTVVYPLSVTHTGSSTAPVANGIGSGVLFRNTDASGGATSTGAINVVSSNISVTTPTTYMDFLTKNTSGSLTQWMRLTNRGYLGLGTTTPTWALSVVDGTANSTSTISNGDLTHSSCDQRFSTPSKNPFKVYINDSGAQIIEAGYCPKN